MMDTNQGLVRVNDLDTSRDNEDAGLTQVLDVRQK